MNSTVVGWRAPSSQRDANAAKCNTSAATTTANYNNNYINNITNQLKATHIGGETNGGESHHHQHQQNHVAIAKQRLFADKSDRRERDSGLEIHSEFEGENSSPAAVKKTASLLSLNQSHIFEPRMAQLETLEAKMASIEVSLSSAPRRKKNGSINGSVRSIPKEMTASKELESLRNALRDKENIIQTLRGQLSIPAVVRINHHGMRNGAVTNNNNNASLRDLSDTERKQAEERLTRLRNDTDAKRLAIKNLKMALERLDITDNIDVRIQQAELEYQLGREELNLLTLLEETRTLQHYIEEANKRTNDAHTLFSCLSSNEIVSMHVAEVVYDPKSPRFGAGQTETSPGLYIDWALDDSGLQKGDRLVEVNGKMVLTKTREDLTRLLQAAPDPATFVVLRRGNGGRVPIVSNHRAKTEVAALRCELEVVKERADEAQRAKDGLRSDNIRLTHRISYLEEQVSELLSRKPDSDIRVLTQSPIITSTVKTSQNVTNINISSQPTSVVGKPQNGDAPALPLRSKSSLSNVSNTLIAPSPQPSDHSCHNKSHRHSKHRSAGGTRSSAAMLLSTSTHNLDKKHHHHHHHHREKDYNSETNSAIEYRGSRKWPDAPPNDAYASNGNLMDQSYRKATKIVHDLTKHTNGGGGGGGSHHHLYEKHKSSSSKCIGNGDKYNADILKHYNARKSTSVLDFRSEIHLGPKYASDSRSVEELDTLTAMEPKKEPSNSRRLYKKLHDSKSLKSLDFDSDKNIDYTSEPSKPKPMPPKKPLRLSLHRAQSLQSVETPPATPNGSPPNDNRKAQKRNHKGEAPHLGSVMANGGGVILSTDKVNGYSVTKEYAINGNGHANNADVKWTSFAHSQMNGQKRDILLDLQQREQRDLHDLHQQHQHQQHQQRIENGFREPNKRHWC